MNTLKVQDIYNKTNYRIQVIKEYHYLMPRGYERDLLFDSEWYETLGNEEANKHYEKIWKKEIMTIRPTKYEDGDLGLTLVLWNNQ